MDRHAEELSGRDIIDPITEFRLNIGHKTHPFFSGNLWWSALIGLKGRSILQFKDWAEECFPGDYLLPNAYDHDRRVTAPPEQLFTLFAKEPLLRAMNRTGSDFEGITSVELGGIVPPDTLDFDAPLEPEPRSHICLPAGSVVTAVIEDGIAFANNLFRKGPTCSRVEFVHMLAAPVVKGGRPSVGRQLDKTQIDDLLKENTTCGVLDEDRFYRAAGLIDFSDPTFAPAAMRRSHGTHVMGIAAGYDMDLATETRPIICAVLPSRVTADTSGQNLYPYLELALYELILEARRFKLHGDEQAPVVFNFSYGSFGGPHDGTGEAATLIHNMMTGNFHGAPPPTPTQSPYPMVLPAGNGNLDRIHARVEFNQESPETSETLHLRILPDDRTASYVEMWVPCANTNQVSVRVTPPGGPQSLPVETGDNFSRALVDEDDQKIGELSWSVWDRSASRYRGRFVLSINPTASIEAGSTLAPVGSWQIEITGPKAKADEAVEVWVQRDETLVGFRPNGRQAHFDSKDYQRFDRLGAPLAVDPLDSTCPVRRTGTLSGYATRESTLVIGGLTQSNGLMSDYSATGPTPDKHHPQPQPDASARSDDSPAFPGVLSAGSRSGSMVRLSGTSVAAPRVARYLANSMPEIEKATEPRGKKPRETLEEWLCKQARKQDKKYRERTHTPTPAPNRTGCGRLDIPVDFGPPKIHGPP